MKELTEEEKKVLDELLEMMSDFTYATMWKKTQTITHCMGVFDAVANKMSFRVYDKIRKKLDLKK